MRIPRLHVDAILVPGTLTLDADASHYLVRVLRRRVDDAILVFDGRGLSAAARIVDAHHKHCILELDIPYPEDLESPLEIHLGIALLKGDRMDTALQKACELGVAALTPLRTERSEVKLDDKRLDNKQRHWAQVLRHAAQQSGRTRLPSLHPPTTFENFCTDSDAPAFIMAPGGASLTELRMTQHLPLRSATLITGPEGGFSEAELDIAGAAGCLRLGAGPRILRAETAPLVGLTLLQGLWGDLGAGR